MLQGQKLPSYVIIATLCYIWITFLLMALLLRNWGVGRGRALSGIRSCSAILLMGPGHDWPKVTGLEWADPPAQLGDGRHSGFLEEAAIQAPSLALLQPFASPDSVTEQQSQETETKTCPPLHPSPSLIPEGRTKSGKWPELKRRASVWLHYGV